MLLFSLSRAQESLDDVSFLPGNALQNLAPLCPLILLHDSHALGDTMGICCDLYLNRLIRRKHNGLIKVITEMRRCGRSFLLF